MGNTGSSDSLGKKISDGFNNIGKKLGEGWESVKNFGNNAWNSIKSVPVLGKIAEGVEKYTPIGWAATAALKGIDTGVKAGSQVLQGDFKGALQTGIDYGRDRLNAENPLLTAAKNIPVLGNVVSRVQQKAQSVPIYGGMSVNDIKSIGNSGLDAAQSFKEGDVKGGIMNIAKGGAGYLSSKTGKAGTLGKALGAVL
jgi:hypothetical protein